MSFLKKYKSVLFAAILFLLPFVHISYGVGLTDIGYNLANYENFPHINATWMNSTWLSLAFGKVLTFLPFGHTMLGISIICTIVFSTVVVLFFFWLKKYFNETAVFFAELLAVLLSWCPKVIIYHYSGYFLFSAAAVLLCLGLEKEKNLYVALSGAVLGISVLARFPNIVQASLGAVIILYWIITKKNSLKQIGIMAGSFLVVFGAQVGAFELIGGKGTYLSMINGLSQISDVNEGYSPLSMLYLPYTEYKGRALYFGAIVIGTALCVGLFYLFKSKILKRLVLLCDALGVAGILLLMFLRWEFITDYNSLTCMYRPAIVFLMLSLSWFAITVFNKKETLLYRLLAAACAIIILITPIGSNNGLYTAVNNLFLVAPVLFGILYKKIDFSKAKTVPQISVAVVVLLLLIQGTGMHFTYKFQDSPCKKDNYETVSFGRLKGMKCASYLRPDLEELYSFLNMDGFVGGEAIIYGYIPGIAYDMSLSNGISHIWPDLDSYPAADLEKELSGLSLETKKPIALYQTGSLNFDTLEVEENEKSGLLSSYLNDNGYTVVFQNDSFTVAVAE